MWGATNCQCSIALDMLEGTSLTEHHDVLDPQYMTQQQCYYLETLKMCTFGRAVRFACCTGCGQYLWTPTPLATTPSAQSTSGSHVAGNSAEPQAVQASGQHPTSTAPFSGDPSAELPSGAAGEEAPSITPDTARNASSTRAGTTVGKTLLCTACMCAKEVAGYSGTCHLD